MDRAIIREAAGAFEGTTLRYGDEGVDLRAIRDVIRRVRSTYDPQAERAAHDQVRCLSLSSRASRRIQLWTSRLRLKERLGLVPRMKPWESVGSNS